MDNLKIVSPDTGEVVGEIQPGDKLIRKKSIDYLKGTIIINEDEPFVKVYIKTMFRMAQSLTGTENQFLNYLIQYIQYNSYVLAHDNGKTLRRSSMANETGLEERQIDRLLTGLVDKQILAKSRTGGELQFYANPYLFGKGKRANSTLEKMFGNTKWARMY